MRADLQQVGTGSFSRQDFRSLGRLPDFREAVATLLEPDEQHLCLPAGVLADAFLGLCLGGARSAHPDQSLPAEQLVRLFLHGALA